MNNTLLRKEIFEELNRILKPKKIKTAKQLFNLRYEEETKKVRYKKAFKRIIKYHANRLDWPVFEEIKRYRSYPLYEFKIFFSFFNNILFSFKHPLDIIRLNLLAKILFDRYDNIYGEPDIEPTILYGIYNLALNKFIREKEIGFCFYCKNIFIMKKSNQKYCSKICNKAFNNKINYERNKEKIKKKARRWIKQARAEGFKY